jgi:hypothetical protein
MSNNDNEKENKTKIKKMLAFDIFQTLWPSSSDLKHYTWKKS